MDDIILRYICPARWSNMVLKCELGELNEDNVKFTAEVRINCVSESEEKVFLSDLNIKSGCIYNLAVGRQDKRQNARSLYRGFRKCCLNVTKFGDIPDQQPGKNTCCPSSLNFRLENPVGSSKSLKTERQNFPLWLKLNFDHNHSLNRADYLKFLDVNEEAKQSYLNMFEDGILPSSAHSERKKNA